MRRLWQQEIIPSLPSISDRAAANEIPALGMFSFPTSNQSSHWWMGFAGRTSHSLSKNETGTSQKINIGNWFIWFEGMFWLSSVSVPGKGWTVGALGSTWSASNLGWDLGQKQKGENTIGEKKKQNKTKKKRMFWILNPFGAMPVGGAGWRYVMKHTALLTPAEPALLLVSLRWTQSFSVFKNATKTEDEKQSLASWDKSLAKSHSFQLLPHLLLTMLEFQVCWYISCCLSAWSILSNRGSQSRVQYLRKMSGFWTQAFKAHRNLSL